MVVPIHHHRIPLMKSAADSTIRHPEEGGHKWWSQPQLAKSSLL